MNEQIKGLAEQAGFVLWEDEPWRPTDVIDWSSRYDDALKKFAELIVRECADWTNENVGLITPEARQDLYKHFGVEE